MLVLKEIKNNITKHISLTKSLYKDKKTPRISKIFLWLAIAYILMPFDLIPDFIPVIGLLDDAIIIPLFIFIAVKLIPKDLYKKHYRKIFNKALS